MNKGYSHVVIGAGAIGSAAAYWLTQRGAERVLVIEQFGLLPTLGSSGDHSRIIRHSYHSPVYTRLTRSMFEAWEQIEARTGLKIYHRTGGLDIAVRDSPGYQDVLDCRAALDEVGISYEDLDAGEIRARFPQWRIEDDVVAIWQAAGGLVDIRRSVSAHTSLALAAGAEFRPHTRVAGVTVHPGSVTVHTLDGDVDADNLVVAAASWLGELMPDLGLDLDLLLSQEQVSYVSSSRLADFTPDRFPVWAWHGEDVFYGFPVYGEAATKLGRDLRGRFIKSEDRVFEGDAVEGDLLRSFLAERLPDAAGPVLANRTCLYDMAPDRDFVLDSIPGNPHVVVFNGAGHAGKFASLVGQILADLTTAGSTIHPIDAFSLSRPGVRLAAGQSVKTGFRASSDPRQMLG